AAQAKASKTATGRSSPRSIKHRTSTAPTAASCEGTARESSSSTDGQGNALKMELTAEEERLLRGTRAPGPFLLAPPAALWPQDCHAWRALAQSSLHAPKLADSAPEGTKLSSLDPRLLFHGHLRTVITPAIATAMRLVAEQIMAN